LPETEKEILENREKELEKLSIPFSIDESLQKVKKYGGKSFKDLLISKEENKNSNTIMVPAVVLSVSAEKKTKKSGVTYYDVELMDKKGEIITRRFSERPEVADGIFALPIDGCKFFSTDMSKYKPLNMFKSKKEINTGVPNEMKQNQEIMYIHHPNGTHGIVTQTNNYQKTENDTNIDFEV